MQSAKVKPSLLPYAVALAILIVNLIFDLLSIYRAMHMHSTSGDDSIHQVALYMMLGSEFGAMVLSVVLGFACTQWLLERRRIAGLPGYAAVCIGATYAVLSVALTFSLWFITQAVSKHFGDIGMHMMVIVNVIVGRVITLLAVALPVWLIFRLLRKREIPVLHSVELRWRALLIFTMFVWAWVLVILQLGLPVALSLGSTYETDQGLFLLQGYMGSFVLVLPAFLGAWVGLPRTMPHTRVLRLLLTSVLALVVCALAMVIVTYVMVRMGGAFIDDIEPGQGFSALVALVWFIVSIPLCGFLVRLLTRKQAPLVPYGNVTVLEGESGFSRS